MPPVLLAGEAAWGNLPISSSGDAWEGTIDPHSWHHQAVWWRGSNRPRPFETGGDGDGTLLQCTGGSFKCHLPSRLSCVRMQGRLVMAARPRPASDCTALLPLPLPLRGRP